MKKTNARSSGYRLQPNIRWLARRRDALLKHLSSFGPVINGSVVLMARTCGNSAQCHCSRGRKHISTYLTFAEHGKTRTVYVPIDLEKEVRRWSADYRALKQLIRQICDCQRAIIRRHVQERERRP